MFNLKKTKFIMRLSYTIATFVVVTAANYSVAQLAVQARFDACKSKICIPLYYINMFAIG